MIFELEQKLINSLFCNEELKNVIENQNLNLILTQVPEKLQNDFHFATNFAMILAPKIKQKSIDIANEIANIFKAINFIEKVEVLNPGFVNIKLKESFFADLIAQLNEELESKLIKKVSSGEKLNLEFISANPTGPLHVAHLRGAVIGDVLASILTKVGYNVSREYYINDAGKQMDTLLDSVYFRIKQIKGEIDKNENVPEGCYPGDYVFEIATEVIENGQNENLSRKQIADIVMEKFVKPTIESLGINYQNFVSEQEVINAKTLDNTERTLNNLGMLYKGFLEKPKGVEIEDYEPAELLLIKTQQFGDDSDRPLKKRDGSWAYIAPDIAYHYDKFKRGFNKMINIFGEDHKGYVKRLVAATKAVTGEKANLDIKLCGMVNFLKDGEVVKMSKRKNNFLTIDDMIEELGKDTLRFLMITRKAETVFNFDLELAKKQTKDNPYFYIQYAHSRCFSVLNVIDEAIKNSSFNQQCAGVFVPWEYQTLLCQVVLLNKSIEQSVKSLDPYFLIDYAISLATAFHNLWSAGNVKEELRFASQEHSQAQLNFNKAFVQAVKTTLATCLNTAGVQAMDGM
jgi:arginyl-tRNA synthetase